ncbi:hypothetical protein [Ferrovum myxofaciens]|uniref:Uncharacterized protein n=1 Tax=Ferrovum myxofaciens TaxID=416213 RepID=A0A9E6MYC5_9PROT|nr:hypothetical protein [Ferrovum myxofaciens]QKE37325.1 MAG: hypothetical protein HO273_00110 [Ferrovum myxofaciens]QWY74971.1 MAG: hypothetical protein JVY19_00565 [Ferrovum myxofaciens]QWY77718.1 MAG: hypothetical protein JZL65_01115 [Ferrovum myxofaciens]
MNKVNAQAKPQNLSSKMTGELPIDCVTGGEYLPENMAEMPLSEFVATTRRAMLDQPDFHQEIAYAALYIALIASWPISDITDLFLQLGYQRDELMRVL